MNNIKNTIKNNYTIIPNKLINDTNLSDRARFLFITLASKPDDWEFYNYNLAKTVGYSIETLRNYMNQLIISGWLTKVQNKNNKGQFSSNNYIINSEPLQVSPYREKPDTVKNRHGKSPTHTKTDNYKEKKKTKKDFFKVENKIQNLNPRKR